MLSNLTFNSFPFLLFFLPTAFIVYRLLLGTPYVNYWLCGVSLFFYATTGIWYLLPLLFTCIIDFVVGRLIDPEQHHWWRRGLFVASITIQISLLSFFKYYGWLSTDWNLYALGVGIGWALPTWIFFLPPGISFYTFHTISYTADIYRGRFKPHSSLIDYITFVTFFPQLVAGPIARASDLLPQIAAKRQPISSAQWETAIWLVAFGLFKKIVLADNFGHLVALAEKGIKPNSIVPGAGLFFAYAFAGQVYCDFSAYTDIARGIAKIFNIELSRNFRTPYFSLSPSEFWTRWHISLSTWLRDYLYIPMGGNRSGRLITLRNLMVTMFLGGLWHGAGIGFIIWGLYHGALLVLYHVGAIERRILFVFGTRLGRIIAITLLFHLVCVGWIFFRATSNELIPAFQSIGLMLTGAGPDRDMMRDIGWGLVLFGVPLALTEYAGWRRDVEFSDLYHLWPFISRSAAYIIIFYGIVFFGARVQNEFIYFQF